MNEKQGKPPDFTGNQEVFGPSGDIGFTAKPSDTNGLRAIEQRYLHSKLNNELELLGASNAGTPFS